MKKWCLMVLAALCLLIPTVGSAQGLPDFLQAVQTGLSEGLSAGSAAMEKDLTLSVTTSDARVEAGRDVTLTIRAENPRPGGDARRADAEPAGAAGGAGERGAGV